MMTETLIPLLLFCLVTSITPGPNNLMLMASGANFGFRRTVPHMLGISIGHCAMVAILGLGLVGVFATYPLLHTCLKVAALVYMVWLAWKFANAAPPVEGSAPGRPMTFLQAAAFQWVNPKAWAMALGAVAAFAPDQSLSNVLAVAAVFAAVNLPSVSTWAYAGQEMRRFLTSPARLRAFNWTMAGLLVGSILPVLTH